MFRYSSVATAAVLLVSVVASPAWAAPDAVIRPAAAEQWCEGQHQGEMVTLAVVDGERILAHQDHCRYFGENLSAQASVDRRGKTYMLLRTHAPTLDSTTGNASDHLSIFALRRAEFHEAAPYTLEWMADVLLSPPEDPAAQWPTTYRVRDTAGGGLEVIVDYSAVHDVGCCTPPEQQVSIQIGP